MSCCAHTRHTVHVYSRAAFAAAFWSWPLLFLMSACFLAFFCWDWNFWCPRAISDDRPETFKIARNLVKKTLWRGWLTTTWNRLLILTCKLYALWEGKGSDKFRLGTQNCSSRWAFWWNYFKEMQDRPWNIFYFWTPPPPRKKIRQQVLRDFVHRMLEAKINTRTCLATFSYMSHLERKFGDPNVPNGPMKWSLLTQLSLHHKHTPLSTITNTYKLTLIIVSSSRLSPAASANHNR